MQHEPCRYCSKPIWAQQLEAHMTICDARPAELIAKPCTSIEDQLWGHIQPLSRHRAGVYVNRKAIWRAFKDGLSNREISDAHGVSWGHVKALREEWASGSRRVRVRKQSAKGGA